MRLHTDVVTFEDLSRASEVADVDVHVESLHALTKAGARYERSGELLGTNHVATEVARMPDGTTLARGVLRHVPPGRRRRDHANEHTTELAPDLGDQLG